MKVPNEIILLIQEIDDKDIISKPFITISKIMIYLNL